MSRLLRSALIVALVAALVTPLGGSTAGAQDAGGPYHPLSPVRILDTRNGNGSPDTPLGPRTIRTLTIAGRHGLPTTNDPDTTIGAVIVNLTATNTTQPSYITAWPTDHPRPNASTLNTLPGRDVANLAVVPVAPDGTISLYNHNGTVDLVADLVGWYPTDTDLRPITPTRILDTRNGNGSPDTPLGPRTIRTLTIAGRHGLPTTNDPDTTIGAVIVNLTATNTTQPSYITAWPTDHPRPNASVLNTEPGVDTPNLAVVPVAADGTISLYNNAGTVDLVADLVGWYPTGTDLRPITPTRILDTRNGNGSPDTPLGPRTIRTLTIAGRHGLPTTNDPDTTIGAVIVNLTATNTTQPSYITAWPTGHPRPGASALNAVADLDVANLAVLPVAADGTISLYNNAGTVDLVADLVAWLPSTAIVPLPPPPAGCPLFPADNHWYADVSGLPTHPRSAAWVSSIGAGSSLKADFGSGLWDGGPIGIPFIEVDGATPRSTVTFDYDDESDAGPYPIPSDPPIEGGPSADGDRHILMIETDECRLYELYAAYPDGPGAWTAGSGAIYDLRSNDLRPSGWTSADAAGLPILPGLVRYEEVAAGSIDHAIRFTAPTTQRAFIWPARHQAGSTTSADVPPMGAWFRLRADVDISGFPAHDQVILRALKTHGMILADNGSSWYLSGAPDERWDNDVLQLLGQIEGSDFEAVDTSSLVVDPDSGAVN